MEKYAEQNGYFLTFTSTFVVCLAYGVQIIFPLWCDRVPTAGESW